MKARIQFKGTYLQNRNRLTDIEKRFVVARGKERRERDGLGIWGWEMHTIPFRMDRQQAPTLAQGSVSNLLE